MSINWSEFVGDTGFEDVSVKEFGIPYLSIVQGLSDCMKKSSPKYIKDAKNGDVINATTNEVVCKEGEKFKFILGRREFCVVEWSQDRKPVAVYENDDPKIKAITAGLNERKKPVTAEGNELIDTIYLFGIHQTRAGDWRPAIISLSKTQYKKWTKIINLLASQKVVVGKKEFVVPWYGVEWDVSTTTESNGKDEWYGWKFEVAGHVSDRAVLDDARAARENKISVKLLETTDDAEVVDTEVF